ncbi:MAG: hypothetical protein ACOC8C_02915 [Chloroflexota bacterium]
MRSPYSSCTGLRGLLARGWKIESPVYVRPHWQSNSQSKDKNTYHFVLWRGDQVNLVSISDSPEMQQFLAEYELSIDGP